MKRIDTLSFVAAFVVIFFLGTACTPSISEAGSSACAEHPGVSGTPTTIEEAVALMNALPKPLTVSCFVEALDRPLRLYATNSTFSAQPADGSRSPRIFIFSGDKLIISVAPAGIGRDIVEFGFLLSDQRSVKGEIGFPVTETLTTRAPYERIFLSGSTSCSGCHAGEAPVDDVSFSSIAIKPDPFSKVELGALQAESLSCESTSEPLRCALLDAIFDHGEVKFQDFPAGMDPL